VTLPLFRGLSPLGKNVFYIITDASDFEVARRMGINYAPYAVIQLRILNGSSCPFADLRIRD
jgi:hypothetical protein